MSKYFEEKCKYETYRDTYHASIHKYITKSKITNRQKVDYYLVIWEDDDTYDFRVVCKKCYKMTDVLVKVSVGGVYGDISVSKHTLKPFSEIVEYTPDKVYYECIQELIHESNSKTLNAPIMESKVIDKIFDKGIIMRRDV